MTAIACNRASELAGVPLPQGTEYDTCSLCGAVVLVAQLGRQIALKLDMQGRHSTILCRECALERVGGGRA